MGKHFRLAFNWKYLPEFEFDMSMADKLLKMGWSIKDHTETKETEKSE